MVQEHTPNVYRLRHSEEKNKKTTQHETEGVNLGTAAVSRRFGFVGNESGATKTTVKNKPTPQVLFGKPVMTERL